MAFTPTPEQEKILSHDLSIHARILAGPGTGKSATVIELLNNRADTLSGRAKLLTFTRAATAELVLKLNENPSIVCEKPSTLHSFCIAVLLSNPGLGEFPKPLRLADDWEKDLLIFSSLSRRLKIRKRRVEDLFGELAANWESLVPAEVPTITPAERARFMGGWREHRNILGYTLPSELPYALRTALKSHSDITGLDYSLLVVDEYQDLNSCDLDVLKEIDARGCAIIGAGDDDQSIYSFRKAHPAGIRQFLEHYPEAVDYPLSITQRCGKKIVEWANFVIQGDPDRTVGRVLNPAPTAPDGQVALYSFGSNSAEARGVAKIAEYLIKKKEVPAPEVLILLRSDNNGAFSGPIKKELTNLGIKYSDPSTVKAVMKDPTTRQSLAMLRLLTDPQDSLSWAALLNLTHGVGDAFFDYVYARANSEIESFGEALLKSNCLGFPDAGQKTARLASELIGKVVTWCEKTSLPESMPEEGWAAWILKSMEGGPAPIQDSLKELMLSVEERIESDGSLSQYLNQLWPTAKDLALAKTDGVRIMTMAGSKGLTVEATILVGLENGIVPKDQCDVAEERRLLYVGMTRAKKYLYGTWARKRTGPTARTGRTSVNTLRQLSHFLEGGPVITSRQD